MIRQRILADPARNDGHSAEGRMGDCLRTCVANLLDLPYEQVPHFAEHVGWWEHMRRWARATQGGDFIPVQPRDGDIRWAFDGPPPGEVIGCGPSPRGPWWHAVVVTAGLDLLHDPHPSDAGLLSVEEVLAPVQPYDPAPSQLALTAAAG